MNDIFLLIPGGAFQSLKEFGFQIFNVPFCFFFDNDNITLKIYFRARSFWSTNPYFLYVSDNMWQILTAVLVILIIYCIKVTFFS